MSIFEDIMNNIEEYPELGELIPDVMDEPKHPVLDWIVGKSERPVIEMTDEELRRLKESLQRRKRKRRR